jgi:hypothetical protein
MPDHCLEVSIGLVGFPPGAAGARAEVFEHQIDFAVEPIERDDRG